MDEFLSKCSVVGTVAGQQQRIIPRGEPGERFYILPSVDVNAVVTLRTPIRTGNGNPSNHIPLAT